MAKYRMDDGTVLDTDKAKATWKEDTRWDGRNHISVNTGSQWDHQTLHLSSKGRYYLESHSNYQHVTPTAEFVDEETAAIWLLLNKEELPEDLKKFEAAVVE